MAVQITVDSLFMVSSQSAQIPTEVEMKKFMVHLAVASLMLTLFAQTKTLSQAPSPPDHLPFPHSHTNLAPCAVGGNGVCWGYAMGRSAGMDHDDVCNPKTMIPLNDCNNNGWQTWSWKGNGWSLGGSGSDLQGVSTNDIIVWGTDHAAFAEQVIKDASGYPTEIQFQEITNAGGTYNSGYLTITGSGSGTEVRHPDRENTPLATAYYKRSLQTGMHFKNSFYGGTLEVQWENRDGAGTSAIPLTVANYHEARAWNQSWNGSYHIFSEWISPTQQVIPNTNGYIWFTVQPDTFKAIFQNATQVSVPGDYSTLAGALADVVPGQTVVVTSSQTVSSSLTVESGVTLQLNPGITITFSGASTRLLVKGHISIPGTSGSPPSFSMEPTTLERVLHIRWL